MDLLYNSFNLLRQQALKAVDSKHADGFFDTFVPALFLRSVATKDGIMFEKGDIALANPGGTQAGEDAMAFSFRLGRTVLVRPESFEPLDRETPAPSSQYLVSLANQGNPDFGQDPASPLPGTEAMQWVGVDDFAEASQTCRRYIEELNLGGGNWAGGIIKDALTMIPVAHVSYNGRVWPGVSWDVDQEPLYEPETRSLKP